MPKTCKTLKCHRLVYENGYCRECWLVTEQEQVPGVNLTGADWENLMESE